MRILLLTNHLNVGGITSYLCALCRQYRNFGHDVFLLSSGGQREEEFAAMGVHLYKAPLKVKSEVHPGVMVRIPQFLKYVRESKADVIHAHTRGTQVLGSILSRMTGVPYVSTCHGFYKLRWFRLLFGCWGEGVAAISPPVKEHLMRDFNVREDRVYLIPNGIDLDYFHPFSDEQRHKNRERFNLQGKIVIGIVARLADVKGHAYLIDAMPEILKHFPDAVLFVAGEGKMEQLLKEQTARLGLKREVIFASVFNPSCDILSLFDVQVMPSLDEGFGLSGMEAQASGLPVVASNVGGIPSFIHHEQTGLLVEPKDTQGLAKAIIRVLSNPTFAAELGQRARTFIAQHYSSKITAQKTLQMYQDVMAQHSK